MVIICPDCGETQSDSARFCNICGSKLPEQTPSVDQEQEVQIKPTGQEQQEPATPPKHRGISKPAVIVPIVCAVVLAAMLICLGPITSSMRYNNIYQRLQDNHLMYQAGDNFESRLVALHFKDDMTCLVHTYYYFDNHHLTQSIPYTVSAAQKYTAEVYIGGQRYTASLEDEYHIELTDSNGNTYTSYSAYTEEELISTLRTDLQSLRAKDLYADYQQALTLNQDAAWNSFGNLSRWIGCNMKDMLYNIFDPYPTITCEPEEGSTTRFVFTVSGNYYINKSQLPGITDTGTMVAIYDTETNECTFTEGTEILKAMDLYYLFGLGGAEKEAWSILNGY